MYIKIKKYGGSSYIPTPEKYSNPKCGLKNIQNDDQECFKWCMKYHQTDKSKNSDRLSVLKKVEDKYNYDNMQFPTSYNDIKTFEENNKVCVMVYTTTTEKCIENEEEKHELVIIRDFLGNPYYFLNDNINLFRITDNEDNSHYVYIKHVSRLFNLSSTKKIQIIIAHIVINALLGLISHNILINVIKFNLMKVP